MQTHAHRHMQTHAHAGTCRHRRKHRHAETHTQTHAHTWVSLLVERLSTQGSLVGNSDLFPGPAGRQRHEMAAPGKPVAGEPVRVAERIWSEDSGSTRTSRKCLVATLERVKKIMY